VPITLLHCIQPLQLAAPSHQLEGVHDGKKEIDEKMTIRFALLYSGELTDITIWGPGL
jgi:hypothetical protein